MKEHEELLRKIHAYRRDRENIWARFDNLLKIGHKIVEYARGGRRKMRQELKQITALLESLADGIMTETPIYSTAA